MNSDNKISITIVVCTGLLSIIMLATTFLQMWPAISASPLPTPQGILQPTSEGEPQTEPETPRGGWEYLEFTYQQNEISTRFSDVDLQAYLYETISVRDPYGSQFFDLLAQGCGVNSVIALMMDIEAQDCVGQNLKGLEYFLNSLGGDGWEMMTIDNTSDEDIYRVNLIFKRPVR